MVLKRDEEYRVRNITLTLGLIAAFFSFRFGLELSWGWCIGIYAPMFLCVFLDAIAAGRTFVMEEQGVTVSLWRFRKTYRWEELQTKRIEEYAALTFGRANGNCPYHKGAYFAPYPVRKPRWIGRLMYATFHPWRFIYVNFYVPPPKYPGWLFKDWRGRSYEVKEEEFLEKMNRWQVELEQ